MSSIYNTFNNERSEIMDPDALCTIFELMFDIKPEQIQIMRYGEQFWVKPVFSHSDALNILAIVICGKACRIHGVVINVDVNEDVYDIVGGNDDVFGIIA